MEQEKAFSIDEYSRKLIVLIIAFFHGWKTERREISLLSWALFEAFLVNQKPNIYTNVKDIHGTHQETKAICRTATYGQMKSIEKEGAIKNKKFHWCFRACAFGFIIAMTHCMARLYGVNDKMKGRVDNVGVDLIFPFRIFNITLKCLHLMFFPCILFKKTFCSGWLLMIRWFSTLSVWQL